MVSLFKDLSTTDVLVLMLSGWKLCRAGRLEWIENDFGYDPLPLGTTEKLIGMGFVEATVEGYQVTPLGQYRVRQDQGKNQPAPATFPPPMTRPRGMDDVDEFTLWVVIISAAVTVLTVAGCWLFSR